MSGRPRATNVTTTPRATSESARAWAEERPRIEPKRTFTPASDPTVPVPLCDVVKTDRNRAPRPSTQANTLPMTVSSAEARRPRTASSTAKTTQAP